MQWTTTLPLALPPIIGRDDALAEVTALLAQTRLLTLTGPGGSGKTCLALHAANAMHATGSLSSGGSWVIPLDMLRDAALLPVAVASALGVQIAPRALPRDALLDYLAPRATLLVLDNCEQLLPGCVAFVETLLQACPQLRVLATSREALRSSYEIVWSVPPLPVPDEEATPSPEQLLTFAAIQLFVQRTAAAVRSFHLTVDNAAVVARICRRLDGLPLALELAASSVRVLTLDQVDEHLAGGGALMAGGYRTAPPRHQTMAATVAWSYQLLAETEQALFRRISLLAGSFGLSAAAAVSGLDQEHVLAALRRLIDASLVTRDSPEGDGRYRLLEVLRQDGRRRLEAVGEAEITWWRYGAWALDLAEDPAAASSDPAHAQWLDRVEQAHHHMRAVLGWFLDAPDTMRADAADSTASSHLLDAAHLPTPISRADSPCAPGEDDRPAFALRLATALTPFWRQRGHIGEGRRWLERGLAQPTTTAPTPVYVVRRIQALNAVGVLAMWQGDYAQAQRHHEGALALLPKHERQSGIAAQTRFRLGFLAEKRGAYAEAKRWLAQSRRLWADLGDGAGADAARNRLGMVALYQAAYARAQQLLQQSLAFQRARQQSGGVASTLLNLGLVALDQGDAATALPHLEESLARNRALGDHVASAYALAALGDGALGLGLVDRAEDHYREALALPEVANHPELLVQVGNGTAGVLAQRGQNLVAAQLWGATEAIRTSGGLPTLAGEQARAAQVVAAARAASDPKAFALAWEIGRSLSPTAVVALATAPATLRPEAHVRAGLDGEPVTRRPPVSSLPDKQSSDLLRIYGLGLVEVYRGHQGVAASAFTYTRARELLYYLLNYPARTREQIGLAFWPDATSEQIQLNVRVILYHLRRALGGADWILRTPYGYVFNRARPYWYDVEAFVAACTAAQGFQQQGALEQALAEYERAGALYRGDFWAGAAATDWIAHRQDALSRRYLDALLSLGQLYQGHGESQRALDHFLRAVARDPYREEAHRGVLQSYLFLQEPSKAVQHYTGLRRQLQAEFGADPAPATTALLQAALSPAPACSATSVR